MSLRNFYQTFYQTEQLFRLDNDPFAVQSQASVRLPEAVLIDMVPVEAAPVSLSVSAETAPSVATAVEAEVDAPVTARMAIEDPIPLVGPELVSGQPVRLEAAPVKIRPSTHRPARPDATQPLLNHKVLILVDEELLPSDVLFLEKILNAINLNINGVDLLNVHGLDGVDFEPILAGKVIHHFLTFGVPFQRLNLDILMDRYQPVRFHGITFMLADPLAAIEGDKNLKKRLWEALKRIFLMG